MKISVRKEINDVAKYVAGKPISEVKRELGLSRVVKMASNENPLGCSEKVKDTIKNLVDGTYLYPDAGNHDLIKSLSENLGVNTDEIFLGGGSSSLIKVICNTILSEGDESIMAELTFPLYENYTKLMGAKAIKIPMKDLKIDIEKMVDSITEKTKIIWLCNPNNPTGSIFTEEEFAKVLCRIPKNILIVMDEAYIEYVTDLAFPNSLELFKKHKNILILRTFSKAYGLASLRIGYGVASKELVESFNRVINPFEVNLFAQNAAVVALADKEFLNSIKVFNDKQRKILYKGFEELNLKYMKSEANFILVDINGDDKKISDYLLANGYIIRAGFLLGYEGCIRVSIGKEEENIEILELLKSYKR
ncbi:histidinol-phosphate transaminase [uncultured Clostridium sp.]|uniref:histidinol-phosphate transaminase n=1 Tax=uncultured Clostridium sp. TaxID=59620 RepID=UPI002612BA64|nr:histidinol-phosphate transaminase [uncultured Clostridium sp.]